MEKRLMGSGADYPDILADMLLEMKPRALVAALLREEMSSLVRDRGQRGAAYAGAMLAPEAFEDLGRAAEIEECARELSQRIADAELSVHGRRMALARRCEGAQAALEALRLAREAARELGDDGRAALDALAVPPVSVQGARRALEAFEAQNPKWESELDTPSYSVELASFLRRRLESLQADREALAGQAGDRMSRYMRLARLAEELENDA